MAHVLHQEFGIEKGLMNTIHAYTAGQSLVDGPKPADWGRGRAAAQNIVPTTTGAASAVGQVLPELDGKLDGMALRVPTPTGSVVDLTVLLQKATTVEAINDAFRKYAAGEMKGVLAVSEVPMVSSDCVGDNHSSIIDLTSTSLMDGTFAKVLSFYDNEWGYTNRLVDLAELA
jgi:glyceraldehyde 3-phosphate dehydrogenase